MIKYYCNRIDIMPAHHLSLASVSIATHAINISDYMPWQRLSTVGLIQVEETELLDKGRELYEIKVKAKMKDVAVLPAGPCVLRLTTTSGDTFVMGWWNKPFPVVTTLKTYAASAGDNAGCYFSASLKSEIPLLRIL